MQSISLFSLFWLFAYIGFCTIGGGLVGISVMQQELIPRGLITMEEFYTMVAVSESTPGPIGVNMATFIGYRVHGVFGGIIATLGIVFPSFVVIIIIALFVRSLHEKPLVKKAFYGIRASSTGMIAVACYAVLTITVLSLKNFTGEHWLRIINGKQAVFFALAFVLMRFFKKLHPLWIILAGAIFGIIFLQ